MFCHAQYFFVMSHSQGPQNNEFEVHVQKALQVTGMHQN